jgi:hypothetical protein
MKKLAMLFGLCVLGWLTWKVGSSLSSDALGMAVGIVFGLLASVPGVLVVLAIQQQQLERECDAEPQTVNVYVITNNTTHNTTHNTGGQGMPLLADRQREIQAQHSGRVFKVVGERGEWNA